MPMPKKPAKYKHPTISVSLTPDLVKRLDKERPPDETRSSQFRRLLYLALDQLEKDRKNSGS
jgi:hypothetical protein